MFSFWYKAQVFLLYSNVSELIGVLLHLSCMKCTHYAASTVSNHNWFKGTQKLKDTIGQTECRILLEFYNSFFILVIAKQLTFIESCQNFQPGFQKDSLDFCIHISYIYIIFNLIYLWIMISLAGMQQSGEQIFLSLDKYRTQL